MDHVHYPQIGARGDLHLNAHAYAGAIHFMTLDPVDIARRSLFPPASRAELFVEQFADGRAAIGVLLLLHEKGEALDDSLYLINEGTEAEAFRALLGSVVVDLFNDFGHDGTSILKVGFGDLNNWARAAGVPACT